MEDSNCYLHQEVLRFVVFVGVSVLVCSFIDAFGLNTRVSQKRLEIVPLGSSGEWHTGNRMVM